MDIIELHQLMRDKYAQKQRDRWPLRMLELLVFSGLVIVAFLWYAGK